MENDTNQTQTRIISDTVCSGLVLLDKSHKDDDNHVVHLPITLFPSPIPRRLYSHCQQIQQSISKLMLGIARDIPFISSSLSEVLKVDEFTKSMFDVMMTVEREGLAQPVISCINRADYLLNKTEAGPLGVRQVEVNAIASGMSTHCCRTEHVHRLLMQKYDIKLPAAGCYEVPQNNSKTIKIDGLMELYDCYKKHNCYILMVTEERNFNFSEHAAIEFELLERRPDIKLVRKDFVDLHLCMSLGPNKELLIDDSKEIAVVYYRIGYDPSHYTSELQWQTRLKIERSRAIKCPSINFHLSGVKKFQQVLNDSEKLEKFLTPLEATAVAETFCKFWSLDADTDEGKRGYQVAIRDHKRLVLKPQREGGGNNIYGSDIPLYLERQVKPEDRSQYILMEYIDAPKELNWHIFPTDKLKSDQSILLNDSALVSELGIYGCIIANETTTLCNRSGGYLMRSKKPGVHEGGVAAGHAAVSSLITYDDEVVDSSTLFI